MRRLAKIHYAANLCRYPVPRTIMFGSHCSNGRSQRLAVWLPIPDSSPYNFDLGCCRWGRKQSQRCQESCYGTDEPHLQHGGQVCLFISRMGSTDVGSPSWRIFWFLNRGIEDPIVNGLKVGVRQVATRSRLPQALMLAGGDHSYSVHRVSQRRSPKAQQR